MRPKLVLLVAVAVCLAGPLRLAAQQASAPPGHLSFVEGEVDLERDGRLDAALSGEPFLVGDRLQTDAGRAEVSFRDGTRLMVDRDTRLDLLDERIVRLLEGRIRWTISGTATYRVDGPPGTVLLAGPGEFRLDLGRADGDRLVVSVARGRATLENLYGTMVVSAGEQASLAADRAPTPPQRFNAAAWDAFDRWTEARRVVGRRGVSSRYLPPVLAAYGWTLDRYGSWRHFLGYGYVWVPHVAVGWRPYFFGRWRFIRPLGWTWIGADPWVWPTHYYGRWGFVGGLWFWIPGTVWAPAWVSWVTWPGFVGWCPLGVDGRPVVNLTLVVRNGRRELALYQANGLYEARGAFDGSRPADGAWTIVPRGALETGADVARYATDPRALLAAARSRRVETVPPPPPSLPISLRADPSSAPAHSTGSREPAVGRGSVSIPDRPRVAPETPRGPMVPRILTVPRSAGPSSLDERAPASRPPLGVDSPSPRGRPMPERYEGVLPDPGSHDARRPPIRPREDDAWRWPKVEKPERPGGGGSLWPAPDLPAGRTPEGRASAPQHPRGGPAVGASPRRVGPEWGVGSAPGPTPRVDRPAGSPGWMPGAVRPGATGGAGSAPKGAEPVGPAGGAAPSRPERQPPR